ncbi:unnamed protein product [Allacma fusca]|uniref:Uncharacterized protein n=1 Tax=Allacma fusca TaxID=39272 RepID=A0A8J2PRN0_9HEXA|nr:unnamed protein product [Allacma fusca]
MFPMIPSMATMVIPNPLIINSKSLCDSDELDGNKLATVQLAMSVTLKVMLFEVVTLVQIEVPFPTADPLKSPESVLPPPITKLSPAIVVAETFDSNNLSIESDMVAVMDLQITSFSGIIFPNCITQMETGSSL